MADVPGTMAPMHKDDLEKFICEKINYSTMVDGLGKVWTVSAHREPGEEPVIVLRRETDPETRTEWTMFRIGR